MCGFLTSGLVVVASCAGPDHKRLLLEWTINRIGDHLINNSNASIFSALAARYAKLTRQVAKRRKAPEPEEEVGTEEDEVDEVEANDEVKEEDKKKGKKTTKKGKKKDKKKDKKSKKKSTSDSSS